MRRNAVGRRALRKIDPSLDLSKHLLEFERLPRPWNAEAIFGRRCAAGNRGRFGQGAVLAQRGPLATGRRFSRHRDRAQVRPLRRRGAGQGRAAQRPGRVGRRHADFRRVDPRQLAGRSPRLLPRSLVEEAAPQAPRDERDLHAGTSSGRCCRAARCTSGPTSRSIFRRRWNCWPPARGSPGRSPCRKRPPKTTWPTARISSGGMRLSNEPVFGRSSGRRVRRRIMRFDV